MTKTIRVEFDVEREPDGRAASPKEFAAYVARALLEKANAGEPMAASIREARGVRKEER